MNGCRLLVLLPTRAFGGHERMLMQWLREAVVQHRLRVVIHSADNAALWHECACAGLGAPALSYRGRGGTWRDFLATWRLLAEVPREVPVLLAPGVLQASLLQWLAVFLRRRCVAGYVPMAYSSRCMRFRGGSLRDWLAGVLVRRVDAWITISPEQSALLVERWRVRPPVFVVRNRIALLAGAAAPARRTARRSLRVLFAGRFDANQKGLDWLCEELRASRARWRGELAFKFMGAGGFAPQLAALSRELGGAHVTVHGWGDVRSAMAEADALLLPSRFEGVPLVALEAIHFGVPVVASRTAGVSGLLAADCLFDFGDAPAMWAALRRLRDPRRRAAALQHARQRVDEAFSPASFRREIEIVVDMLARMGTGART